MLAIDKTTKPATYKLRELIHGKAEYGRFKDTINKILPKPPEGQSLLPDYEIVFIPIGSSPTYNHGASSFALYAARIESDGISEIRFQEHAIDAVKNAIADGLRQVEQAGRGDGNKPPK